MMFTQDQKDMLGAKLDKSNVKSRKQGGGNVSYIEGWHAIAEANRIFGFDGWDRELRSLVEIGQPVEVNGKWRVGYRATVRVTVFADGQEIIRDGSGFGQGIDRDVQQAHESGLKEAETDAMKRALMTFGNPFGLALYDKTRSNVGDDEHPKNQKPQEMTDAQKRDWMQGWSDKFIDAIGNMQQFQAVEGEYKKHIKTIDKMQNQYPDIYQAFIDKYEDRRDALVAQ